MTKMADATHSQAAFLLCRDKTFQHFINERSFVLVDSEETARACVLEGCNCSSRSDLDKDGYAQEAWVTQFYNPWLTYQDFIKRKAFT
jgi:hypothetical protein